METSKQFLLFLQSSITPVALISGVGLLLLTLTNRLARTIDRSRSLLELIKGSETVQKERLRKELGIMYRRSTLLRNAIGSIVISMSVEVNHKGYHYSYMSNPEACTGCIACALVCPDRVIDVYRVKVPAA
jgi:NAD-dependent dihydropyrimidine dehydrogenase PreA subunit